MSWAIVTGASAGLGVEFAKLCAEHGHSVILVARRKDRLEELAKQLQATNPKIQTHVIVKDLSQINAAAEIFSEVQKITSDIDVLINNAGFGAAGPFPEPKLQRQLEMIDLNIRAVVELTGLFLPRMKMRKMGRILNVGSMAGFQPGPYMSIYYATKAFVNSFSEALHEELKGSGVSCTVLAPGPVHTEFGEVAGISMSKLFKAPMSITPREVAKAGYNGMCSETAMVIPGMGNKMIPQVLRVTPRAFIRRTAAWLNRSTQ